MSIPLEESEIAKQSFAQLSTVEQGLACEAIELIGRNPEVGKVLQGWREPTIEYTYTTPPRKDIVERVTVVYQHTPGLGVTVVFYFRDPQKL